MLPHQPSLSAPLANCQPEILIEIIWRGEGIFPSFTPLAPFLREGRFSVSDSRSVSWRVKEQEQVSPPSGLSSGRIEKVELPPEGRC